MLTGYEHRELIREYFRSRRRGQLVLASLPGGGQEPVPVLATEIDTAPFVDWHVARHADAPKPGKFRKQAAETAGFLLDGRACPPPWRHVPLEAARAEAAKPVTDDPGPGGEDGARAPFRRKEL